MMERQKHRMRRDRVNERKTETNKEKKKKESDRANDRKEEIYRDQR